MATLRHIFDSFIDYEIPVSAGRIDSIDWGDGTVIYNPFLTDTHSYDVGGDYTMVITGDLVHVDYENKNCAEYLIECISLTYQNSHEFVGCSNLIKVPASIYINNGGYVFLNCFKINDPNIITWDTSGCQNFKQMFRNASSFNQNVGGWNFENAINMLGMFDDCGLTISTYDAMLTSFSNNITLLMNETVQTIGIIIGVKNLKYTNITAHNFLEEHNIHLDGDIYVPSSIVPSSIVSDICFVKDTLVKTDQGTFPIQTLTKKHTIHKQPILHITKTIHYEPSLVKVSSYAFGTFPTQDTYMSMKHKIYLDSPIQAKNLINDDTVLLVPYDGEPLYNVLLEKHSMMKVHGMLVETMDPTCLVALFYKSKLSPKQKEAMIITMNKDPVSAMSYLKRCQ